MSGVAPYAQLTPHVVLDAIEALGCPVDGRLLALNSYENRVYQVGIEDALPLVAKFYRPNRWSDAAILEEHAFSQELVDGELPVVAPLEIAGRTLHRSDGYAFALYPRQGGRSPELEDPDVLTRIGQLLGRLHLIGQRAPFRHRLTLDVERVGEAAVATVLELDLVPEHIQLAYRTTAEDLLERIRRSWARAGAMMNIRLHGDCHAGNLLWTDAGPHVVDLDDAVNGPALQDLWMLLSGQREEMTVQLGHVLDGYETFRAFDRRELHVLEALRSLRLLHYAAWLGRRWQDPAFPRAFPWFAQPRYWEEHILALREQAALLDEPPLAV